MDYKKAASYWIEKDEKAVRMGRDALLTRIEKFIMAHNTCALATGCGDFVRCTPMEYSFVFFVCSEFKKMGFDHRQHLCLSNCDAE